MDITPRLGDSDNALLFKIAQALEDGAVSGITEVAADARYVLKSGDVMTGSLEAEFIQGTVTDADASGSPVCIEAYHNVEGATPLNGCGAGLDFRADSDTTERQLQVRVTSLWGDVTHATRDGQLRIFPVLNGVTTEALRISNVGVSLQNGAALQIAGSAYHNPLATYAAGTAYTLTAVSAAVDFGTTDPVLTVNAAGTYRIRARVNVRLNAATFAANQTLTVKVRRTNNTAADVANSTTVYTIPIVTALTQTLAVIELPEVPYVTANTDDAITIFAVLSATPGAGSVTIEEASITAIRLS